MSLDSGKIISELSNALAARSRSGLVNCLSRIKNNREILDELVENGGLAILVNILSFKHARVIDLTLSILGNYFLTSDMTDGVQDTKIAESVVWILKNLPPGATLHCRACRLVGNMSVSTLHARVFLEAKVVPALAGIFDSDVNAQTLSMAVRALRNLWSADECGRTQILNCNLVQRVTSLLTSARAKLKDDTAPSKYHDLSETCLKALKSFSSSSDPRLVRQMRGRTNLSGYRTILEFCKTNNRMAFQILYKLCQEPQHRPDLGTIGAVEYLVSWSTSDCSDSSSSPSFWEVIATLCMFAREAVNRARLRDAGGLKLFLHLLADPLHECYHSILLHALTQFVYDDASMEIMIRRDIVMILVARLRRMVRDVPPPRKRTADTTAWRDGEREAKCVRLNRYSLDFYSPERGPCIVSSPCSSPANSSPRPDSTLDPYDEDDNYSPVCSDTEDWDADSAQEAASQKSANVDSLEIDLMLDSAELDPLHAHTLCLLTYLALWRDPIQALAEPGTVRALIEYIAASGNCAAPRILMEIINKHAYFRPLVLQGFVFDVQTLGDAQDYLQRFCGIAASGGAFGELANILIRGSEAHRLMVAVSIPFLVKSKDNLRKLLQKHGAFEMIFSILADEKHPLNGKSVLSVCQLAQVVGLVCESVDRPVFRRHEESSGSNDVHSVVTFVLDDGETFDACRRMLCVKSQVFSAMLEGQFFEASQKSVRLPNVSREGLEVLCLAASGQLYSSKDNVIEIEALLDAVLLANKFLMERESEKLTETSMARLSHENLIRAWKWARANDCPELKMCCVKNFLTYKISCEIRLVTFRDFAGDVNFSEFLDDVRSILEDELTSVKHE